MATTSFKKEFIVKNKNASKRLWKDVDNGKATVSYTKKDVIAEKEKGDKLLARLASA